MMACSMNFCQVSFGNQIDGGLSSIFILNAFINAVRYMKAETLILAAQWTKIVCQRSSIAENCATSSRLGCPRPLEFGHASLELTTFFSSGNALGDICNGFTTTWYPAWLLKLLFVVAPPLQLYLTEKVVDVFNSITGHILEKLTTDQSFPKRLKLCNYRALHSPLINGFNPLHTLDCLPVCHQCAPVSIATFRQSPPP